MTHGCNSYRRFGEPISERHVQAIWYDRDMRPENLVSRDGAEIRVIDPGRWNLEAGPDFKDAVLEVGRERRRLCGDIEIHLNPSDWENHGHGGDPAYRNVVAHVTWRCGPIPASLPPGALSIWIGRFVTARVGFTPEQIDLTAYPFARLPTQKRPCFERLKDAPDLARAVLAESGRHRMRMKARRIAALLAARPGARRQILYEEIMNALGYRHNSRGFRRIAETVPLEQVMREPENAEAAMLSAACFIDWWRAGVRPRNSPENRIRSAAALFANADVAALADATDFSIAGCRGMLAVLRGGGVVGRGRSAAVLANVVLPFAVAEGRVREIPDWLPAEDISEVVRLTAFRMFGRDHNPHAFYAANGLHIQGIIQIHRDFCLQVHPDCGECGLVASLGDDSREAFA